MKLMLKVLFVYHLIPIVLSGIIYFFDMIKKPWFDIFVYIYLLEFIILCIWAYLLLCEYILGTRNIPNIMISSQFIINKSVQY